MRFAAKYIALLPLNYTKHMRRGGGERVVWGFEVAATHKWQLYVAEREVTNEKTSAAAKAQRHMQAIYYSWEQCQYANNNTPTCNNNPLMCLTWNATLYDVARLWYAYKWRTL